MSKRSVGLLLILTLVIAVGTLVQDFRFDGLMAAERASALAVDRQIASIAESLTELRAAQAGYVAVGQAPAGWMTRAGELVAKIESGIGARQAASVDADALRHYDAADQAMKRFKGIDQMARSSLDQGDRLHASDLVFMDATQALDSVGVEISAARAFEERAMTNETTRLAALRLTMNGVALVIVFMVAVYFSRALAILGGGREATMAEMIRDLPPPVKNGAITSPAPLASPSVPALTMPAAIEPATRPVALDEAAELCVDLARVLDGRDIQALLERAATLLDAKGLVVWAADTGGALLRPSFCQGYSERVMARLRPLQVDSDNVTSLAFRSLQPQTLPGASPSGSAAIAVPLIASSGCVGVLAAEIRQSHPHPDLVPLARIVAALFSTLVAPTEDSLSKTAEG